MKGLRLLVAVGALVSTLVMPTTASAGTEVCAGTGIANTPPLYYPGMHPGGPTTFTTGPFYFDLNIAGGCLGAPVPIGGLNATGFFSFAWCGHSQGSVTLNGHHTATFVTTGTIVVIAGVNALGVAQVTPDLTTTPSQSCLIGGPGATKFIVTGAVVLI